MNKRKKRGRKLKSAALLPSRCKKIRAMRLKAGIRRNEWAKVLSVSFGAVVAWETGNRNPKPSTLKFARIVSGRITAAKKINARYGAILTAKMGPLINADMIVRRKKKKSRTADKRR